MKPQLSNGYGSPLVVIDATTKQPMSGAIVMFPETDRASFNVLRAYLAESNMKDDERFMDWFRSLEQTWKDVDGIVGLGTWE